jgi:hypothetical protein
VSLGVSVGANLIMQKFRQLLLHPSKKYSFGLRKTEQFVEIYDIVRIIY